MVGPHRFGMFAKYWEPGAVKTRLASGIGAEPAAAVYLAFLEVQLARFAGLFDPLLVFSPAEQERRFRELLGGDPGRWDLKSQGGGDLGARMQRFFGNAFADGYEFATLIGSDAPTLPLSYIHQAASLLRLYDVVLGPTEDGGYYLVAARQTVPPIFTGIEWSTANVWRQTIGKLQEHRICFVVLPTWYDVDNVDDLVRLREQLESEHADPLYHQLRERLEAILSYQ